MVCKICVYQEQHLMDTAFSAVLESIVAYTKRVLPHKGANDALSLSACIWQWSLGSPTFIPYDAEIVPLSQRLSTC